MAETESQKEERLLAYVRESMKTLIKYKMVKVIDEGEMIYDQIKLENTINDLTRSADWFIKFLEADEKDHLFWSKLALSILEEMNVKPTKRDMRGIYMGLSSVCIMMSTDWLPDGKSAKQFKHLDKDVLQVGYDRYIKMNNGFISLCKR